MGKTPQAPSSTAGEKSYSRAEFVEWLTESCRRQHLPVTITNPSILADIATLLRTA